jgi:serine/threonine protein kinase
VNTDIKLENVVLGDSQPNRYPAYKTPKMIDFGLAYNDNRYRNQRSKELPQEQQTNPAATLYRHIGTPGCRPPVCSFSHTQFILPHLLTQLQQEQFNPPHHKHVKSSIDARADTWNVGEIIFELLEQNYVSADTSDFKFVHSDAYNKQKRYYSALPDLVQRCLHENPSKRPHINALLYETKKGLEDWEHVNTSVDKPQVEEYWNWKWQHGDDFTIGTHVPKHWRWATRRREDDDDSDSGESMGGRRDATPSRAADRDSSPMEEWDVDEYVPDKTGKVVRKRGAESEAMDSENHQTGGVKRARGNEREGVRRSKRQKRNRYDWMN